jgi:hypothetical protein
VWNDFIDLQHELEGIFTYYCDSAVTDHREEYGHYNWFWRSRVLDMGHISVVDKRESHGIWMMHVNAYSKSNTPMPIYGFDVVCSKKKVTGCFHDLSPTGFNDMTMERKVVKRERELPEWAKEIFSENMIAAGNIRDQDEMQELAAFGMENLERWFIKAVVLPMAEQVEFTDLDSQYAAEQYEFLLAREKYCHNQLQNPHSFKVMLNLGFPEDYLSDFKSNKQFPY